MNRQMKRAQERAERQQKRTGGAERQAAPAASARRAQQRERRERASARQFLREVRQELRKVDWPTRRELATYTTVVLVTVVAMTSLVFGLDYVFQRVIFDVIGG